MLFSIDNILYIVLGCVLVYILVHLFVSIRRIRKQLLSVQNNLGQLRNQVKPKFVEHQEPKLFVKTVSGQPWGLTREVAVIKNEGQSTAFEVILRITEQLDSNVDLASVVWEIEREWGKGAIDLKPEAVKVLCTDSNALHYLSIESRCITHEGKTYIRQINTAG